MIDGCNTSLINIVRASAFPVLGTAYDEQAYLLRSFYKFVRLSNYTDMQRYLSDLCENLELLGTILLAENGINASVCGKDSSIGAFWEVIRKDERLADIYPKDSRCGFLPSGKLKVRLKRSIVNLDLQVDQTYLPLMLSSEKWDEMLLAHLSNGVLDSSEIILIDVRNIYEYNLGSFLGAISCPTEKFTEFPQFISKLKEELGPSQTRKVLLYCTGGIRVEAIGALVQKEDLGAVYQLDGGILKYLQERGNLRNLWQGECFVFDDRLGVDNALLPRREVKCHNCQKVMEREPRRGRKDRMLCILCFDKA